MTPDEVRDFLDDQGSIVIATMDESGQPRLVAMWFVLIEGRPHFWTYGRSQKVVNLRRNPRLTALAESGSRYDELRGVELRGTGAVLDDQVSILEVGRAMSAKYSTAGAPRNEDEIQQIARKRVVIRLDVEGVLSWDHRKA